MGAVNSNFPAAPLCHRRILSFVVSARTVSSHIYIGRDFHSDILCKRLAATVSALEPQNTQTNRSCEALLLPQRLSAPRRRAEGLPQAPLLRRLCRWRRRKKQKNFYQIRKPLPSDAERRPPRSPAGGSCDLEGLAGGNRRWPCSVRGTPCRSQEGCPWKGFPAGCPGR